MAHVCGSGLNLRPETTDRERERRLPVAIMPGRSAGSHSRPIARGLLACPPDQRDTPHGRGLAACRVRVAVRCAIELWMDWVVYKVQCQCFVVV